MGTNHATAEGRPNRATKIAYVTLALCALGTVGVLANIYRLLNESYVMREKSSQAVYAALADPAYVERFRAAGYRVGLISPHDSYSGVAMVKATCARSNEVGPLPCDLFPYDPDRPGIIAQIE